MDFQRDLELSGMMLALLLTRMLGMLPILEPYPGTKLSKVVGRLLPLWWLVKLGLLVEIGTY